jgi:DNA polymerase I
MRSPLLGALDFETEAIGPRPHAYPPVPVGVALRSRSWSRGRYLAWGHPTRNNTTRERAMPVIADFVRRHLLLCHNAKFDLDVLETHIGFPWPNRHEDTLILAFLNDPDSWSLSLKPLAERYLGQKPTEQDELRDWILANVPGATSKNFGSFICKAPGDIVGRYAIGDVDRTIGLYDHFWPLIKDEPRFICAYERELKVTRTLVRMERRGLPLATKRLRTDIKRYEGVLTEIEKPLMKRMKVKKSDYEDPEFRAQFAWAGVNFAQRLVSSGIVDELPLTEKGNLSTSADSLKLVLPAKIACEFEVRAQIATCLNTFMGPWLLQAEGNGGLFYGQFNQVRNGDEWGNFTGARTGRLSMTPNLQNVIRSDKDQRVPVLRDYIIAGPWAALAQRDYSQQELRLLAHYENGPFLRSYLADPTQDAHELVRGLIRSTTGLVLDRRPVKDLNFGLIYGQGLNLTAEKLGVDRMEAKKMRNAHAAALPGLPDLQKLIKGRVERNEPIWTWGGRRYYCEPRKYVRGRWMSFEYKMLNKLIQGSAADVTKQGMVNYDALWHIADDNPLLLQIHDELIVGLREFSRAREVHEALGGAMANVEGIAVPMLSDGKLGRVSWHRMKKVSY